MTTRRARRSERGSTMVEFALVTPILLGILLGILQYGYHYWALETASATAREAARRYAVGTEQACTVAEARNHASTVALSTVTVSPPPSAPAVGDVITVTVSFQSLDLNIFPLPDDGLVAATAQTRVESVPTTPLTC